MDIAVIKTGGKQYLVQKGSVVSVEAIPGVKEGDSVTFDSVLFTDDGKESKLGAPMISGAKVTATAVEVGRGKKIVVVKYKAKSRYHKKRGHRQPFLKVKIESL
ncbi:50S ribosomal protein L21 [Patescibacteria group bacterium]|nr:50S ribosomal protein L21 [Patescibacteria group bacterium]